MLILEAILNFRKARIIRRLYKYGLLDAIRPWLTLGQDEETESLIDCTLNFLLEMWITKSLISNYDFGIGKAIVKVKKNGSPGNQALADKVHKRWMDILTVKEEEPKSLAPKESVSSSQGVIALPRSLVPDGICCSLR